MQPRDVVRLEHQFAIMSTCTVNVTSAHGLNEIKGNRSLSTLQRIVSQVKLKYQISIFVICINGE